MDDRALLDRAVAASQNAHAPYSGFAVGAAVLARDGRVVSAANVENASYGLSLCAERAALAAALAGGIAPGQVEAVAVTATPCGACRQWMVEFRVDRIVYLSAGAVLAVRRPEELLPDAFDLPA